MRLAPACCCRTLKFLLWAAREVRSRSIRAKAVRRGGVALVHVLTGCSRLEHTGFSNLARAACFKRLAFSFHFFLALSTTVAAAGGLLSPPGHLRRRDHRQRFGRDREGLHSRDRASRIDLECNRKGEEIRLLKHQPIRQGGDRQTSRQVDR